METFKGTFIKRQNDRLKDDVTRTKVFLLFLPIDTTMSPNKDLSIESLLCFIFFISGIEWSKLKASLHHPYLLEWFCISSLQSIVGNLQEMWKDYFKNKKAWPVKRDTISPEVSYLFCLNIALATQYEWCYWDINRCGLYPSLLTWPRWSRRTVSVD